MKPDNFQHRASLDKAKHRNQKASARCLDVAIEHPPHSVSHKVTRIPILLLYSLLRALVLVLAWGCASVVLLVPVVEWAWALGCAAMVSDMDSYYMCAATILRPCHRVLFATRTTVTHSEVGTVCRRTVATARHVPIASVHRHHKSDHSCSMALG